MAYRGRRKISADYTPEDLLDEQKVRRLVNGTMPLHIYNAEEIDYLVEYRKGVQPIIQKEKVIREEISNNACFNHAQMITRNIVGYFLGNPIQYIQNGGSDASKTQIEMLNRFVAFEDKASVDQEIGEYQSICGTAYKIIITDGLYGDDVPFEERCLNPKSTYVIYTNDVADIPLCGITYYSLLNDNGIQTGLKLYVYTQFGVYEFETDAFRVIQIDTPYTFTPYDVGGVPIVEYPNNQWRIGDWELVLDLMDSINSLTNGRLDDIDQIIQSLIVFVNAEIDTDVYDEMRQKGVVMLKNLTGNQSSVDTITSNLDQAGLHLFAEELESLLYALVGIPDRNKRGGGGGDTGQAVELRDGWADLEVVVRNKEALFKKAEKMSLKIILSILKSKLDMNLSLMDVDIKFTRNKTNNLMVKTQSYTNLLATKTISPSDCLTVVDLVSDVNEYIARGKEFWKDNFASGGDKPQPNPMVDPNKVDPNNLPKDPSKVNPNLKTQ